MNDILQNIFGVWSLKIRIRKITIFGANYSFKGTVHPKKLADNLLTLSYGMQRLTGFTINRALKCHG